MIAPRHRVVPGLLVVVLAAPACADLGALLGGRPKQVAQDTAGTDVDLGGSQSGSQTGGNTDTPGGSGSQTGGASPAPGFDNLSATVDGPFVPSASAEIVR